MKVTRLPARQLTTSPPCHPATPPPRHLATPPPRYLTTWSDGPLFPSSSYHRITVPPNHPRQVVDPMNGDVFMHVADTAADEVEPFIASLNSCSKSGLHNPLKVRRGSEHTQPSPQYARVRALGTLATAPYPASGSYAPIFTTHPARCELTEPYPFLPHPQQTPQRTTTGICFTVTCHPRWWRPCANPRSRTSSCALSRWDGWGWRRVSWGGVGWRGVAWNMLG